MKKENKIKKLAIVSSFNESCGNASFSKILRDSIQHYAGYQVEVIPLNLSILQSSAKENRKAAEIHINEICAKLKKFDAVNIQLENGLYGSKSSDIINRVTKLIKAHPKTSVTLHSPRIFLPPNHSPNHRDAIKKILSGGILSGIKLLAQSLSLPLHIHANRSLIKILTQHNIRLIVHTNRAAEQIIASYGYKNIDVHPLQMVEIGNKPDHTALDLVKAKLLKTRTNTSEETSLYVGMFGYISEYKGHLDAIKAMKYLPPEYKLLIFGRQHPQTVTYGKINNYLKRLLLEIAKTPSLQDRIFFMGEVNDEDFINYAASVDIVWLPYYENGQDGSGIASICFDVAKRILCSSSFAFDELLKLIPYKNIQRFDIGNYLEIANKTFLMTNEEPLPPISGTDRQYSIKTQAVMYTKELNN